jgi:S1-C subfamily serine protease
MNWNAPAEQHFEARSANIVRLVTGNLLEHVSVRRGFLGIQMQAVRPEVAEALDLPRAEGVLVREVLADTAAEAAGIEPGDVIVSVDGEDVVDSMDLRNRVGLSEVGDDIRIGLVRGGKRKTVTATIGELAERAVAAQSPATDKLAGATVRDLTDEHELYGRVRGGVEVVDVAAQSPAASIGLRPGDVILAVNRQRVSSVREFDDAVASQGIVGILFQRGNRRLFTYAG